jgi:type II secretory pathway pseudopilin PulG
MYASGIYSRYGSRRAKSLTRAEIVGAWLHIWTAPKGVEVPPVPVRKLLVGAGVGAVVVAIGAALVIPPLQRGKEAGAARRARESAAALRAEIARLRVDQRPRSLRVPRGKSLSAALERAITADAVDRAHKRTITGPILGTRCEPSPSYDSVYAGSRVYKCFVKTSTGHQGVLHGDRFGTGYPFVATIYVAQRRLVWCKENPRPDEKGRQNGDSRLSRSCAGRLSEIL